MQPGGAIAHDDFENRFAAVRKALYSQGDDLALDSGRSMQLQVPDEMQLTPVFVAPGTVQEQILHGMQTKAGQLCGALGSDAAQVDHGLGK
jgi:hypothetical protein